MEQQQSEPEASSSAMPLLFPAPPPPTHDLMPQHVNGAADLLERFNLLPLYATACRPYLPKEELIKLKAAGVELSPENFGVPRRRRDDDMGDAHSEGAAPVEEVTSKTHSKSYGNYVSDLPGKVQPWVDKVKPVEGITMKDIVFRPETTIQRIVPFDQETLRSSFLVRPGEVKEIDLKALEAEPERPKKKKKRPRVPDGATAPK